MNVTIDHYRGKHGMKPIDPYNGKIGNSVSAKVTWTVDVELMQGVDYRPDFDGEFDRKELHRHLLVKAAEAAMAQMQDLVAGNGSGGACVFDVTIGKARTHTVDLFGMPAKVTLTPTSGT